MYGLVWTEDGLYTYVDDDQNRVLEIDLTADGGSSFWEMGGWDNDAATTEGGARGRRQSRGGAAAANRTGAMYPHEKPGAGAARRGAGVGSVDNPWRGQGANAPFDQEFYLVLNLAVGGTNGYFPDGEGGKMWSDESTTAFQDFNNALPSVVQTWTQPSLQIRSVTVTDDI